jgi:hypothetical protein
MGVPARIANFTTQVKSQREVGRFTGHVDLSGDFIYPERQALSVDPEFYVGIRLQAARICSLRIMAVLGTRTIKNVGRSTRRRSEIFTLGHVLNNERRTPWAARGDAFSAASERLRLGRPA